MKYRFTNDYSEIAHPRILSRLLECQNEQNIGYGFDVHTDNAVKFMKKAFNCENADIYILNGGTQTNLTVISYALKPYEAVLACDTGHINVHETGAIEGTGHKVFTLPNSNGKLTAEDVRKALQIHIDCHMVKIGMVYVSNSTETGTVYTKKELEELYKVCKENDLYFFIDGARLSSALMSKYSDVDPKDMSSLCDVFYAGGTKIGMTAGEAVIILNDNLKKDFKYHIKNKGALNSKGFILGIQFEEAFKDGLYFEMGKKENELAYYLASELEKLNVKLASNVETNQIFIVLDNQIIETLKQMYGFEMWEVGENKSTIRLVVSFATKKESVDMLISDLKEILHK